MTLHNYRSRQVHKTLNGVNPSSSFRDMRSAKSGPNLWQIWQVFGPWASPYGANGQITMTVHNYRPRQFHRTSNGENPSSGYRDMGSASLAAARPAAHPPEPWRQYPSSPKGWGVKRGPRSPFSTLRPRQNGRQFPDIIFKWIFLNENAWILINISLKFVPRGPINNIPTLVQVMASRRPGDKPLSETMIVRLPTHICVTRTKWVNTWKWWKILQDLRYFQLHFLIKRNIFEIIDV